MDLEDARRKLVDRKRNVQSSLAELETTTGTGSASPAWARSAQQATSGAENAANISAQRWREVELGRICAALRRIDEDEYGKCLNCGARIEPAQLKRDPAAAICASCAGLPGA